MKVSMAVVSVSVSNRKLSLGLEGPIPLVMDICACVMACSMSSAGAEPNRQTCSWRALQKYKSEDLCLPVLNSAPTLLTNSTVRGNDGRFLRAASLHQVFQRDRLGPTVVFAKMSLRNSKSISSKGERLSLEIWDEPELLPIAASTLCNDPRAVVETWGMSFLRFVGRSVVGNKMLSRMTSPSNCRSVVLSVASKAVADLIPASCNTGSDLRLLVTLRISMRLGKVVLSATHAMCHIFPNSA